MKRRIVQPSEFAQAFGRAVAEREADAVKHWSGPSKPFTEVFCEPEKGVLASVAVSLDLKNWPEYLKIDAVFLDTRDDSRELECVAVEHENAASSSTWEVHKLCLLDMPLRVLVTYPKGTDDDLLSSYEEIIRNFDTFGDFGTKRRLLVIFGRNVEDRLVWAYYVWEPDGFAEVTSQAEQE